MAILPNRLVAASDPLADRSAVPVWQPDGTLLYPARDTGDALVDATPASLPSRGSLGIAYDPQLPTPPKQQIPGRPGGGPDRGEANPFVSQMRGLLPRGFKYQTGDAGEDAALRRVGQPQPQRPAREVTEQTFGTGAARPDPYTYSGVATTYTPQETDALDKLARGIKSGILTGTGIAALQQAVAPDRRPDPRKYQVTRVTVPGAFPGMPSRTMWVKTDASGNPVTENVTDEFGNTQTRYQEDPTGGLLFETELSIYQNALNTLGSLEQQAGATAVSQAAAQLQAAVQQGYALAQIAAQGTLQEQQQARALSAAGTEAAAGRGFAREERVGAQEFAATQQKGQQGFQSEENLRQRLHEALLQQTGITAQQQQAQFGRETQYGLQAGEQAFARAEAALGRTFTSSEREAVQAFQNAQQQASFGQQTALQAGQQRFEAGQGAVGRQFAAEQQQGQFTQQTAMQAREQAFAQAEAVVGRQFTRDERTAIQAFQAAQQQAQFGQQTMLQQGQQRFEAGQAGEGRQFAREQQTNEQTFAAAQSALGREFTASERQAVQAFQQAMQQAQFGQQQQLQRGEQAFTSEQAALGRGFATQERLGGQEFAAGQQQAAFGQQSALQQAGFGQEARIQAGAQQFQSAESERQRQFQQQQADVERQFQQGIETQRQGFTARQNDLARQLQQRQAEIESGFEFNDVAGRVAARKAKEELERKQVQMQQQSKLLELVSVLGQFPQMRSVLAQPSVASQFAAAGLDISGLIGGGLPAGLQGRIPSAQEFAQLSPAQQEATVFDLAGKLGVAPSVIVAEIARGRPGGSGRITR